MISVSRAGWDARPPDSTTPLNRSSVTKFIVHYSGASRSQTVRSIQNFCMDQKDHVDIDYNRIVHGDYDYMGRGWNVGGHTKDNNSTSYGVCMIGLDSDVTNADKRTIREIYDQVCAELGRSLTMATHRSVLGASYTDCPGLNLHNWVMSGMPYPEVDVDANDVKDIWQHYLAPEGYNMQDHLLNAEKQAASASAKLDNLVVPPAQVDPAALKAVLLDPEVLAAIAKTVNDDAHRRLQS